LISIVLFICSFTKLSKEIMVNALPICVIYRLYGSQTYVQHTGTCY
jgi:hypothetical protein